MNLETDWIKYESSNDIAYYGYATPGTRTDEKLWSIRKVSGTGSSFSVDWNMNVEFLNSAIWDNKEDHFTHDASQSVTLTYSIQQIESSFTTRSYVYIKWNELPGADFYRLNITDQNGILYNHLNEQNFNPFVIDRFTTQTKNNEYTFVGVPNMTYSISFASINQSGKYQEALNIDTIIT